MTSTSYAAAWLIYFLSSCGLCAIAWQLAKPWVRVPALRLALPLLAFLLTPYFSDPGQSRLAPALLTVLFEGLFGDPAIATKAALPLLLVTGLATLPLLQMWAQRRRPNP